MHLDNIRSEDIVKLEIGTGVPLIYEAESSENIKRVN
jgi:bisphosphoglycerate-dependent phosphoglycerate mutase